MNPAHPCVQAKSERDYAQQYSHGSPGLIPSFPAEGELALQSGDVASRYCLPDLLGRFERNTISILLDTGFLVFCRKLHVDGICIKLQNAAIINNWLEAELSHKRLGDFCNTVFTRTCFRAQLL